MALRQVFDQDSQFEAQLWQQVLYQDCARRTVDIGAYQNEGYLFGASPKIWIIVLEHLVGGL